MRVRSGSRQEQVGVEPHRRLNRGCACRDGRVPGERAVSDRHAFDAPDKAPERNVHVALAEAPAVRNHLALRNALRADGHARARYEATKRRLVEDPTLTIDEYVAGKTAVIRDILESSGALTSQELDDISRQNESSGRD